MAYERNEDSSPTGASNQGPEEVKGLTQEGLGEKSGVNYKFLGGIERGVENPSLSVLLRIATGLGVDVAELFRFRHEETNPAKLKKTLIDIVNSIEQQEVEKLQIILKILSCLKSMRLHNDDQQRWLTLNEAKRFPR